MKLIKKNDTDIIVYITYDEYIELKNNINDSIKNIIMLLKYHYDFYFDKYKFKIISEKGEILIYIMGKNILNKIYKFSDFYDLVSVSKIINDIFKKNSSLYFYNNFYYLFLDTDYSPYNIKIDSHLSEYALNKNSNILLSAYIKEKGKIIFSSNAINLLANL